MQSKKTWEFRDGSKLHAVPVRGGFLLDWRRPPKGARQCDAASACYMTYALTLRTPYRADSRIAPRWWAILTSVFDRLVVASMRIGA